MPKKPAAAAEKPSALFDGKPTEEQGGDDDHEKFEQAFAAMAYVNMCLDRGYTLANTLRLAPAMGVDATVVPAVYKRALGTRLREGKPIGGAGVVSDSTAAAPQDVNLSPSQVALSSALQGFSSDVPRALSQLRGFVEGGLTLEAYVARVAPNVAVKSDAVKGRKLVAAEPMAAGSVAFTDFAALHGVATALKPGGPAFLPAAARGQLDVGGHLQGEAAALAGGSAPAAALALVLQLAKGPLAPPTARPPYAPPPPTEPPPHPSLGDILAGVFAENQFPGCAFLPRPTGPDGHPLPQSAAQASASRPDDRRLTAVFPLASLLNHDCAPNVRFSSRWNAGAAAVEARMVVERDVAPGEELTLAYVDCAAPRAERQAKTVEAFGFACACARCAHPVDTSVAFHCPSCKPAGAVAGGAPSCASCGAPVAPHHMAALTSLRTRLVDDFKRDSLVARVSGDGGKLLACLASLCRVLHDADTAVFGGLMQLLAVASGPAAAEMARAAAAARAVGRPVSASPSLSDSQLFALTARAEAALAAQDSTLHSPLTRAALYDELACYYCYAGPEAGSDVRGRAAACFTRAADGIAVLEPQLGAYVALLRELAAEPPMGPEAARAAKERQLQVAARERDFMG